MNKIKREDVIKGAKFKRNRKPIPLEMEDDEILYLQPEIVSIVAIDIVPPHILQNKKRVNIIYENVLNGQINGEFIEDFINNFRYINKVTHCWACRRKLNQNKEKLKECPVCGGVICPDDDNCLCTNPEYGNLYRHKKGMYYRLM